MLNRVELKGTTMEEKKGVLNEVRILASLDHDNIIAYKQAFIDSKTSSLCMVMEYASGGDLRQLIDTTKEQEGKIEEKDIWKYAVQIIKGLVYLHESKIAHRDLKVRNSTLLDSLIVTIN